MTALALAAGLVLDPSALSRLLQLPLGEAAKERVKAQTRLQLTLHGTLIGENHAFALISDPVRTVSVGSQVGSAVVVAIDRHCVTFDDETELCRRKRETTPAQEGGVRVKLSDFAQWTQVRVVPVPNGFQLQGVAPGSIYEKLGVRSGDILRKVNGRPVDFSTVSLVKPGQHLTVELERSGTPYVLTGQLD